jgi:hypothetical protein
MQADRRRFRPAQPIPRLGAANRLRSGTAAHLVSLAHGCVRLRGAIDAGPIVQTFADQPAPALAYARRVESSNNRLLFEG